VTDGLDGPGRSEISTLHQLVCLTLLLSASQMGRQIQREGRNYSNRLNLTGLGPSAIFLMGLLE